MELTREYFDKQIKKLVTKEYFDKEFGPVKIEVTILKSDVRTLKSDTRSIRATVEAHDKRNLADINAFAKSWVKHDLQIKRLAKTAKKIAPRPHKTKAA